METRKLKERQYLICINLVDIKNSLSHSVSQNTQIYSEVSSLMQCLAWSWTQYCCKSEHEIKVNSCSLFHYKVSSSRLKFSRHVNKSDFVSSSRAFQPYGRCHRNLNLVSLYSLKPTMHSPHVMRDISLYRGYEIFAGKIQSGLQWLHF